MLRRKKQSYHHGNLKAHLIKIAGELVEEKGLSEWSLKDAAKTADVSCTAPYRHFKSKSSLLNELAQDARSRFLDTLRKRSDDLSSADGTTDDVERAYLSFAEQEPEKFKLMFSPAHSASNLADFVEAVVGVFRSIQVSGQTPFAIDAFQRTHGAAMIIASLSAAKPETKDRLHSSLGLLQRQNYTLSDQVN